MRHCQSRGRRSSRNRHPYAFRTLYQRDRDRIVHSTAFRRLMYKTQVLVTQTNDHHRTRLTHTLEVAQISRTIARRLGLNEDLTEAIALAHDLGHPPFGHAGENGPGRVHGRRRRLRAQPPRPAHRRPLEYRYADFPGLNLSWEVLEADGLAQQAPAGCPNFANRTGQPLLEAQVVDAADSLAYDTHDVDDALSVGLITLDDLDEVAFWRRRIALKTRHKSRGRCSSSRPAVRGPDRLAGRRSAGAHPPALATTHSAVADVRACRRKLGRLQADEVPRA